MSDVATTPTTPTTPGTPKKTREAWMLAVAVRLRPAFLAAGFPLPQKFRVTVSLTKGRRTVGLCYPPEASGDGTMEVLIRIDQADPLEVSAILAHELVHTAVGLGCGHRGDFRTCAKKIGLVGKLTATRPGPAFVATITPILEQVGPFPHAKLDFNARTSGPKKQKNRHIKVCCAQMTKDKETGLVEACPVTARMSRAIINDHGAVLCPLHPERGPMEADEIDPEDEEDAA